ncbi:OmpH family outer membrane protein [Flavobacteriaceae bacterium]|nr:OmpH family outer membrane protein [Flavobacteriaceae bacterium]
MKKIKNLLFASMLFLGATSLTSAQSKTAHIDTQELIAAMPEMKAAQNQLEKLTKTYQADLQTMATELQNKMKQYQAEASTKTDEVNGQRAQEVQSMRDNVMKYEQTAQQDMSKRQEGLIKPIMEKARVAIQKVARAKGYQYVIDSTAGSGLILADGPNLLNDVKKELGM